MITTIADLLNELRIAEADRIDRQDIKHTTTIGDMYEGLTASILQRAIPHQADLRVVTGFAETDEGVLSGQLDCMIVSGSGRRLPYTDASVWNIRDVLAVVEVKKTLFSSQFETAFNQLRAFLELHWSDFQNRRAAEFNIGPALKAYRLISGLEPPDHSNADKLPFHLEMLYRTLVVELISPIRIVFGYGGYNSEESLREGFFDFLEKHKTERGFGGSTLPALIVCGKFSLVKLNGFPFTAAMRGDRWLIYGSSHQNPLYFLLEMIWTRLSHRFTMPDWFMSDLTLGRLAPVLSGRAVKQPDRAGWEYWTHTPDLLPSDQHSDALEWEPVEVSDFGLYVFTQLCSHEWLPNLPEFTGTTEEEKLEFQRMVDARVIGFDSGKIVLLTDQAASLIAPNGKSYIGENATGRLSAWIQKTFLKNS